MPVRIRLAKKGKIRNGRISIEYSPSGLVKSLLELGDIVVKQLEVVGNFFSPPTEGIRTTTCPPVSRAMLFGVLRSKYGSTMMILTPSRFISPINSTVC